MTACKKETIFKEFILTIIILFYVVFKIPFLKP